MDRQISGSRAFVFLSRMCMCHVTENSLINDAAGTDRRPESEASPGSLDAIVIVCYFLAGNSGKDSELWAEAVDPAEYEDCDKTTPSGSSGNADIWAEAVDPADYEDCDKTPIGDDNDNAVTSWAEAAAADSGEDADCSSNSVVSADNRP